MTKNLILSPRTSKDIDDRVERVLRGLGNPEPPIDLDEVRELLKLDKKFYTANDPSLVAEVISRIRVASIQVYKRPALFLDVVKKFSLKALYVPDQKRIFLDKSQPEIKHRWSEAHEIGHSLIPWHDDVMHGDNDRTLAKDCHERIEAEANFAAGRILFLRDRFFEEAASMPPTIETIKSLRDRFGNTLSTTLYRFVETVGNEIPIIGIISKHPHISRRDPEDTYQNMCRHFIQSPAFAKRFSKISEASIMQGISSYCGAQRGGPLGNKELILDDDNGQRHKFYFETFFNRHEALSLGIYLVPYFSPK